MKVYHYHPESGEYLGSSEARKSPLDPNAVLIPGNATTDPPPPEEPGVAVVRVGGQWEQWPDLRGAKAWTTDTKQETVIAELKAPGAYDGVAFTEPPSDEHEWDSAAQQWTISLQKAIAMAMWRLEMAWTHRMEIGFTSVTGAKVPCGFMDIMMWEQGLKRAQKKGKLEKAVLSDGVVMTDIPVGNLQALIDERDEWLFQLWLRKLAVREAIAAAKTVADIPAISLD